MWLKYQVYLRHQRRDFAYLDQALRWVNQNNPDANVTIYDAESGQNVSLLIRQTIETPVTVTTHGPYRGATANWDWSTTASGMVSHGMDGVAMRRDASGNWVRDYGDPIL